MVLVKINKPFLSLVLATCLISCDNTRAVSQSKVLEVIEDTVNPSKILFEEKCALCHGNDGTAGIGGAADLRESTITSIDSVIRNGRKTMPEFKSSLTENEIKQLTDYVKNLRK